jgi:hypothetical protein
MSVMTSVYPKVPSGGIAGITASASAFTTIDLNTITGATVPAGSTHAILTCEITGGTGYTYGFQAASSSENLILASSSRLIRNAVIPLNGGTTVSLNVASNTTVKWYVSGYTDHITAITPADISSQVTSTSAENVVDLSAILPAGAASGTVLIRNNIATKQCDWGPVGGTSNSYVFLHLQRQIEYVPLDSSRRCAVWTPTATSAGDYEVVGWMKAGCFAHSARPLTQEVAGGTSYETRTGTITAGSPFAVWRTSTTSGATQRFRFDKTGSPTGTADALAKYGNPQIVPVNASGQSSSIATAASTTSFFLMGGFAASVVDANLTSTTSNVENTSVTATFDAAFTPSSFSLSDGTTTKSATTTGGSGTSWTYTATPIQDGVVGLKIGAITVSATNGTSTTNTVNSTYSKAGYTLQDITETPAPNNIGKDFTSQTVQIGDQFLYDATKGAIDQFGVFTSTWVGTQTAWWYSSVDYKWRSFNIDTTASTVTTGLTTAGLTVSGLTTAGLTRAGL